ncbi:mitochondrial import receptor protein [Borealophlyctis nickersoniae]|nr:mitochondrial import receptor protein [Borealophlyctis nickersoniae]
MVQLTEVSAEDRPAVDPLLGDDDDDYEDDDGQYEDIDDDDDADDLDDADLDADYDDISDESLLDRFAALKDVVPPTTRAKIYGGVVKAGRWTWGTGKFLGSAAWVIATGALLVLLPVALELEKEAAMLQQEAQARVPAQQAQQLIGQTGSEPVAAR